MTIATEINRVDYVGNGSTDTYPYTFKIFDQGDLVVVERDTDDVETTLVIITDYTVTGVGETSGGNVILSDDLTSGHTLTIKRVSDLIQETDIRNQGPFYPAIHEDQFDKCIMIDQQQQDEIDRSIKLAFTEDPDDFDATFPGSIAGLASVVPITNADGDGWAAIDDWPSGASIASAAASAAAAAASAAAAAASAAAAAASAGLSAPYGLVNLGLSTAVGSNALDVTLTQFDGSTPPSTGAAAVYISFRSSSANTGQNFSRTATSATSLTVPSGATLGHNDALADYIYVYAIDNAGTIEMAVSSSGHWDEGERYTTTALTTGSDNATTLYSTSARTNVAIRLIGRILSSQTTAGTWAATPTEMYAGNIPATPKYQARSGNFIPKHGITYLVSTAAARTITLPTPRVGLFFTIKDSTGQAYVNNITIARSAAESIDGTAASYTVKQNFASLDFTSDGTNWFVKNSRGKDLTSYTVFDGPTLSDVVIPTTLASPTLSAATFTIGTPVTRSTNTLTFPFTGFYRVNLNLGSIELTSGTTRSEIIGRIRNTTDSTTADVSVSEHIDAEGSFNPSAAHSANLIMYVSVTDTAKNYEIQWAADQSDTKTRGGTVDSINTVSWRITIEHLTI